MAIVFISPKQRQKMFFMGITILFLLFLIIISLSVFLAKPTKVSSVLVFNKPKVSIDLATLDSDVVKNLRVWEEIKTEFQYEAKRENDDKVVGKISAVSIEEAQKALEDTGLTVTKIEEIKAGRSNPFAPYYEPVVVPKVKK